VNRVPETDEFGIWTDEPTVRSRVAAVVAGVLRWLTKPSPTTRPPGDTNDARAPGQSAGGEI
jgi:hypothetical protein